MFRKLKTLSLITLITLNFHSVFAQNVQIIYKVLDARLSTRLCKTSRDAIERMDEVKADFEKQGLLTSANTEENLIIENMINLERYNYMYEKDMKSAELKPFILSQYDKINAYKDAHPENNFSPWFILSSGDVINSSMQFIPQATAIKQGLREKDEYDTVVNENPQMSFALINSALWYYFAPAIGGGSKSVAKNQFSKAVEYAQCDYERFYSRVYLSQIYYDENKKEECKTLLDECDKILEGNIYIPFIRMLNDQGYSLLYYTTNREKVDKKLGR